MTSRFITGALACALAATIVSCGKSQDKKPSDATATHDSAAGAMAEPAKGVELGSREGRFNVSFPPGFSNPEEKTMEVETPAGKLPMTLYTSAQDTTSAYMVAFVDYPEKAFDAGIESMLDGAREGALKNMSATLEKQENVTLNGAPGRSITFNGTSQGRDVHGRVDYYIAKPRLYEVLFLSSDKARVSSPEVVQSFKSFTIQNADSSAGNDTTATGADSAKK